MSLTFLIDILNEVEMRCQEKLDIGYYPTLKNVANSGVTDDVFAHTLESGKY